MKTLIITDTNYTKYLKKAFYYENIKTQFVNINKEELNEYTILGLCTTVIFLKKDEKEIFEKLQVLNKDILILCLSDKNRYEILGKELPKKYLFRNPYDYSKISEILKSHILKYNLKEEKELKNDKLLLNIETREVYLDSINIKLNNREFELLKYLIENKGLDLLKKDIIKWVWDRNSKMTSNTLEVHIKNLRKKLRIKNLVTIHGIGYKFS